MLILENGGFGMSFYGNSPVFDLQILLRTKLYGGGQNQFVNLHKFTRVNRFFIETYFVMEVRAGGATTVA